MFTRREMLHTTLASAAAMPFASVGSVWAGDDDVRGAPMVSRDGGRTWSVSTGWPALFDGATAPAIRDEIIVMGAEHPTGAGSLTK